MRNRTRYNKVPTNDRKYRRRGASATLPVSSLALPQDDDEEEDEEEDEDVPNEEQLFLQQNASCLGAKHASAPTTHIELNRIYKHHEHYEEEEDEDEEEPEEPEEERHEYQRRRRRSSAAFQQQQKQQHIRPHLPSTRSEGHIQTQQSLSRGVAGRREEATGQLATLVHIPQEPPSHRTSRLA